VEGLAVLCDTFRWPLPAAVLDRLSEHSEGSPPEGGEIVQEEDTPTGEVHLSGPAAADEGEGSGAEVGSAEGSPDRRLQLRPAVGVGDRASLLGCRRREDARQAPGEQRLPRGPGAYHQDRMPASGGDLHGALGRFLGAHVGEV
jgi:hypothetical protein